MPLVPTPKNCDPSVKKAIQILTQKLGLKSVPTFAGLTLSAGPLDLSGKLTVGSFASPIDVTNTRQYGFELHYSGNDYNATAIRARAHAVTSDTSAQFQGGLFQAANNDDVSVGILNGLVAEAIGKATTNAATITMMRGALIGAEWSAKDTVTDLRTLHVRTHTRDAATEGYVSGTGYGIYIENEAVGGNGQALDAGIYFKGTNLSAGNKAFTYGIDFTGGTYGTSQINLTANNTALIAVDGNSFIHTFQHPTGDTVVPDGLNIFIGVHAGNFTMGSTAIETYHASYNVGIGYNVLSSNTLGQANFAMGYEALRDNTIGRDNVAIGYLSLPVNTTGIRNVGVGTETLEKNISGRENVAIGYKASGLNISGVDNVAIGCFAGYSNETGTRNTAVGKFSLRQNLAHYNTAIGYFALYSNTTGRFNIGIGYSAGHDKTTGFGNVYIGSFAFKANTTGAYNIGLGYGAGYYQTGSNTLVIDNQIRADANTELTNAILYGVMAATPASQTLRVNAYLKVAEAITGIERSADPTEPIEGEYVIWMSDGTGKGDDGDIMIASQAGGVTNYGTLFDHSGGAGW